MTDNKQYDALIIGLGPVGSMAAILLSRAGLKVAAVERDAEVYRLPRAVNLDGEIVRALQPVGLAEEVAALLQPVREGERAGFANSRREYMFGNELSDFGANGWQALNFFDQPELEGFLRRTALDHPNVTAYVGYEAAEVTDHGDRVAVQIGNGKTLTNGETLTLEGGYLLACDGAASPTRKALGIGWENLGYDKDWLVVDVITRPGHTLGLDTLQVCAPERITTYVCTKDPYRRWEFKLNEGETWEEMLEPAKIESLIEPWTPHGTYEIRRAAMYQFHAATASTWQVGRIFIAGDAAHQTPPFLGQGMNAGMRDAVNIAWKLAMVIRGDADPALLTAYEAERKAHAHDLVDWAVKVGQLMEHFAAVEAAETAGEPPPELNPELLASGYGQSREMPPLRAGVLMEEQVSEDGATGYLFSQPIVATGEGDKRLDELLGPGFAVVARTEADLTLSEQSRHALERLGASTLIIDGLSTVRGRFDRGFETSGAMVVRPDRYVFGHTTEDTTLDDLVSALDRKLHLN